MPETFTYAFAERLNRLCSVEVKEAENGDEIKHVASNTWFSVVFCSVYSAEYQ